MKKLLAFILMTVLATSFALANDLPQVPFDGNDEDAKWSCMRLCGQDAPLVAKWDFNGISFTNDPEIGNEYTTLVAGNKDQFAWNAQDEVSCVIAKENGQYQLYEGGYGGGPYLADGEFSQINFCGGEVEVPELGTIGLFLGVIGALGVFAYSRKQN